MLCSLDLRKCNSWQNCLRSHFFRRCYSHCSTVQTRNPLFLFSLSPPLRYYLLLTHSIISFSNNKRKPYIFEISLWIYWDTKYILAQFFIYGECFEMESHHILSRFGLYIYVNCSPSRSPHTEREGVSLYRYTFFYLNKTLYNAFWSLMIIDL